MTASLDWYFDFVSPYSYIAFHRLREIPADIIYRPVLFAGLLNHWGQKGPAEIPAKRQWTYRWCTWWAGELGIPFRFPASHPFNPLQHLRLAIAAGCTPAAVRRIFDAIWVDGGDANDPERFSTLCKELRVDPARLGESRDILRKNTDEAAACGVFGVPSFVVDGEVFWGFDATGMVVDYLEDPHRFNSGEMARIDDIPATASRT